MGRATKNQSIDSFSCSPPRKSLVKGERFVRVEGKPELLKLVTADDIFNMIWEIHMGQRTNNLISTHAHQRRKKAEHFPNPCSQKILVIQLKGALPRGRATKNQSTDSFSCSPHILIFIHIFLPNISPWKMLVIELKRTPPMCSWQANFAKEFSVLSDRSSRK